MAVRDFSAARFMLTPCGAFFTKFLDTCFVRLAQYNIQIREIFMTKAELVEKIHAKAGLSSRAKAEEALDAVISCLRDALASGETVTLTNFGSFKVNTRAERKGRNPRTKEEIIIPASKVVKFTPGKPLKDAVN